MINEKYFNNQELMEHFLKIVLGNLVFGTESSIISIDPDTMAIASNDEKSNLILVLVYSLQSGEKIMEADLHYKPINNQERWLEDGDF